LWKFEKTPPNSGGVAGCGWQKCGNGGNSAFFFVFCAIGVGLTRPNPTREHIANAQHTMGRTHRTQHTTATSSEEWQ